MKACLVPARRLTGFSLVEVVLALGIFAFAMVAMLALFGTSIRGVRMLGDRDALVAAGGAVPEQLARLSRQELAAIPAGTNPAAGGRPTFYGYTPTELAASEANTDKLGFLWTNSLPSASDVKGPRLFRVRLYRAMRDAAAEHTFAATNISFPVRVVVEALAPDQPAATAAETSWSFHRQLIPVR